MSVYEDIMESINQAIEYERGNLKGARRRIVKVSLVPRYRAADIKRIRNNLNLSQALFSELLGVSVKTVEAWEAGRNIPIGPAQRMLGLLEKKPELLNEYMLIKNS